MLLVFVLDMLMATAAAGAPSPVGEPAPAAPARALSVVPRAAWDAAPLLAGTRYRGRLRDALRTIVVHHSDFLEPPGPLGIKDYHLEVSGFADIGYHFVIEPDGTVYEGRPLDRTGAHAGVTREAARGKRQLDPDWGSVGIVLDGYFGEELPPLPQRQALLALIDELRARFPKIDRVIGHREVRRELVLAKGLTPIGEPTVCPGDALFLWLDAERREHRFRGAPPRHATSGSSEKPRLFKP
ncbi:MAG: N-acetylmuramoyl-L-alanine amidase [Deltaproteobacteria bacterium]|nr:N-acetylmuramoyl-L-alanine amidase [Deltaproteobacteria bacterium]